MLGLIANIQNEMDASYQEKSMLTDLFTKNKFWGLGWITFNLRSYLCNILFPISSMRRIKSRTK
tara:strand:+ start:9 stop:200 length:192 start_codon:yes stop_codon:yes gene_type:complete